ncbi:MAG: LCP family protein [Actinobacteria bacterium]|nr:LCP family protein [Actinomycetota bacterium]
MRRWLAALALTAVTELPGAGTVWAQGKAVLDVHRVDEGHFNPAPGQPVFVLALGTDGRAGLGGDRSDAIHLIGVNPALGAATILNIPRDTYVPIPGHGRDKINSAYQYGGPSLTAETVEGLTGVHPSFLLVTNFPGLTGMVDELGGIDVDVPFPMNDHFSGARFPQGRVHMGGDQALAFSRNRHIPDGDVRRTEDQATLIIAALAKLRSAGGGAVEAAKDLAVLVRHTDLHGVGLADLYHLGRVGLSIDPAKVRNMTMPSSLGNAGAASVVFPSGAAGGVFADFRDDAVMQSH